MMFRPVRHRRYLLSYKVFITLLVASCNFRRTTITSAITTIIDDTSDVTTTTDHNHNVLKVLTREQIESYHNDGYLYIKAGLLSADLLNELATAVQNTAMIAYQKKHSSGGYFSLLQSNNIFLPSSSSSSSTSTDLNHTTHPTSHVYRNVVMDSVVTKAVAELMNLNATRGDTLRCLRYVPRTKNHNPFFLSVLSFCDRGLVRCSV